MPWGKCKPVYNPKVIGLCGTHYYAHSKGCHNFCSRRSCPPTMKPLSICLDDFWLVYIKWPIGEFVRRKLVDHPEWSIYQARNVLYWQATARKAAEKEVEQFSKKHLGYRCVAGTSGHIDSWGIDLGATIAQLGVTLRWGKDWANYKWTYVLRCMGRPIEEATPARLVQLAKLYPAIYRPRVGRCRECEYRPCLGYLKYNPSLYVGHSIGRDFVESYIETRESWLIRCILCGKKRVVPITNLLCQRKCRCLKTRKK